MHCTRGEYKKHRAVECKNRVFIPSRWIFWDYQAPGMHRDRCNFENVGRMGVNCDWINRFKSYLLCIWKKYRLSTTKNVFLHIGRPFLAGLPTKSEIDRFLAEKILLKSTSIVLSQYPGARCSFSGFCGGGGKILGQNFDHIDTFHRPKVPNVQFLALFSRFFC